MSDFLLIAAAVLILLKMWQGWRLGVVRQLVNMGAAVVAGGFAVLGASAAGAFLKPFLSFPAQLLVVVGGLVLGVLIFGFITIVGALLFKKTGDQSVTVVRVGFGITGAALGAVYGVMMVIAFAMGLRLFGTLAEAKLAIEKNPRPGAARVAPDPRAVKLVELKKELETGPIGSVLRHVDPLPETTYATLTKMATLTGNQKGMQRFMNYPGVRSVMDNPKVAAVFSDPEIQRAIHERRFMALLSNPRLVAAADDPDVTSRLKALEFEKALDYALQGGSKQ